MAKLRRVTPVEIAVRKLSDDFGACPEARQWYNAVKDQISTFGELQDDLATRPALARYRSAWASWCLKTFGADCTTPVKKAFLDMLPDYPMTYFRLYLTLPWLSDEEDEWLRAKFESKLPRAEHELREGIVTRAKDSA